MTRKPCCKDCPDRHEKCHMECEKYAAFRKELEATKEWLKEKKGDYNSSPGVYYNPNRHRYENKPRGINPKAWKKKLKGGAG